MLKERGILIIEDCEVTRERLWLNLKDNFRVFLAATASEGLNMLTGEIDVVILDYMLPDMAGADVLRKIKACYPSIPVIIITGFGSEEICQKVFRIGAIDYIKKPFDLEEIKKKVELLLKIRSMKSERRQPIFIKRQADRPEDSSARVPSYIMKRIMRAKNYIDENYMTNVHISEITKEAGMNRTYFCTYFKLVTGQTFKDYLVNKRLTRAKELLRNGDLRISDIADQVGYSSKYFSEVFKKSFHIPPKKSKS